MNAAAHCWAQLWDVSSDTLLLQQSAVSDAKLYQQYQ